MLTICYVLYILNSGYNADKLPLGKLSKTTILKVSLYLTSAWKFPFFIYELDINL
jgi:hypothetical protein